MENINYTNSDGVMIKILLQGNHIVIEDPREDPTNQDEFLARANEYDALIEEAKEHSKPTGE